MLHFLIEGGEGSLAEANILHPWELRDVCQPRSATLATNVIHMIYDQFKLYFKLLFIQFTGFYVVYFPLVRLAFHFMPVLQ
jgi:hypothetical protein